MTDCPTSTTYSYVGYHGCQARCGLEIWRALGVTIVVVSELRDNPGTSVTNMAEGLATQVCRELGISPQGLVWIEHYPESKSWARVSFDFDWHRGEFVRPTWKYIALENVDALRAGSTRTNWSQHDQTRASIHVEDASTDARAPEGCR